MGDPFLPGEPPMLTPEQAQQLAGAVGSGARWVGTQTAAAGSWISSQAQSAATWTANQAKAAGNWAVDTAKSGTRGTVAGIADPGYDAVGGGVETVNAIGKAASNTANAVSGAAKNAYNYLLSRKPDDPCVPCEQAAAKAKAAKQMTVDKAADGCLIGAGCQPTCKAGENLTKAELAKARANPVKPSASNDCCAKKRAGWKESGKPPRQITYVNGINTTKAQHCATLQAIANQTCADVTGVYNATEGFRKDAIQTSQDRLLIKAANEGKPIQTHDGRNPAVDSLSDVIYDDVKSDQPTELWAHSQGGAVSSLSLYEAQNEAKYSGIQQPLKSVSVTSFGSAAPYWPKGLGSSTHYVNVNDFTPFSFGLSDDPSSDATRAPGAAVIRFAGPSDGPFVTQQMPRTWLPAATANHGMDSTYLTMARQRSSQLSASGQGDADCG